MTPYYTYDSTTKRLTRASDPATIDGQMVVHPSAAMYAQIGAYPARQTQPPDAPEGKVAVPDGYALEGGEWIQQWRFEDAPAPTLEAFDFAMEEHLTAERMERGYTTREPDSYLTSSVPRWAQDARDWVAHRDAVMEYALGIMNAVKAGAREPPTVAEFKAGLPQIEWSCAEL